ncbi:MAG: oxidative damage protection protein [Pseudohongiella sp.]|uniref:oxidative damage protection protein n=1 Tax=Pseudohongiella sp. TaxID=1979412 RepID=UPI00349FF5DA
MTRTVFCKKYQKELPGLAVPPFPGAKGQQLFDQISAQAWQDWQKQQVMLINEKQLSMASADDRRYLQEQMDRYFANESFESASGYVPPEAD